MKVLFDARWILVEDRFDGVSRYSYELAHALAKRGDIEIAWLIHDKRQLTKLPPGEYLLANNPNDALKEWWSLAQTINRAGYRCVYSPFFMMGTRGKRYKLVLTIHDMIYFTYRTPPQWLPWHIRLGWWLFHLTYWPMRWQLNRADVVATVSDSAHDELIEHRATRRPLLTVPNAVGNQFYDPTPRPRHTYRDIVYIGAFTPYKNVECLIDMMQHLPNMTLHLCGKLPESRRGYIMARIKSLKLEEQITLEGPINDNRYRELLSGALCAISASRMEGFGLPVIEAQSAGVPFVAADTPIFHEVGGDSVLYFDPDKPQKAATQVHQLTKAKTSAQLIKLGYSNSARYTWDASAARAARICRSLAK